MTPSTRQPTPRKSLLATASIAAILILAGWIAFFSGRDRVKPHTRNAFDFVVTWRCLACGYEESARAGVGPRRCPQCNKNQLYVCIRHACPKHGVFPVAFQYDTQGNPIKLKVADGPWVPYADEDYNVNARCPRCGAFMMPVETPRPAPQH